MAVKLLLKNNSNLKTDQVFKYFMQFGEKNEENIHDLCYIVYETQLAKSYLSELKFKRGLRMLKYCVSHMEDYFED